MNEGYLRDVVSYLEKNIAKGYNVEGLKIALQNQGYPKTSIEKALIIIDAKRPKTKPINEEKPKEEPVIEKAEEKEERGGMIISFLRKIGILK